MHHRKKSAAVAAAAAAIRKSNIWKQKKLNINVKHNRTNNLSPINWWRWRYKFIHTWDKKMNGRDEENRNFICYYKIWLAFCCCCFVITVLFSLWSYLHSHSFLVAWSLNRIINFFVRLKFECDEKFDLNWIY